MQVEREVVEKLKCQFSTEELIAIGDRLAKARQSEAQLEAEKKYQAAAIKMRQEELSKDISDLSKKFSDRHEERDVRCRVYYNNPENGHKRIIRTDIWETVRITPMEHWEMQEPLPFEPEVAEEPAPYTNFAAEAPATETNVPAAETNTAASETTPAGISPESAAVIETLTDGIEIQVIECVSCNNDIPHDPDNDRMHVTGQPCTQFIGAGTLASAVEAAGGTTEALKKQRRKRQPKDTAPVDRTMTAEERAQLDQLSEAEEIATGARVH